MELTDFLGPKQIVPELGAKNRWEAIDELISVLAATGKIPREHVKVVREAVERRERCVTTGVGHGVGGPTGNTQLVNTLAVALGRSSNGVDFEALDEKPVYVVLLSVYPAGSNTKYMHVISKAAKLLFHIPFREAIAKASSGEAIYKIIIEQWDHVGIGFNPANSLLLSNLEG